MAAPSPTYSRRGLRLERVIGMSASCRSCLAVNPADESEIAYPAGCVVVLYCARLEKQRAYMRMAKPVSCLAYSPDGKFLAVGEKGHNPAITVWDISTHVRVAELRGHHFGVSCLCFAPNSKHLVSVGVEHDGSLILWNWPEERPETQIVLTEKVLAAQFNPEGKYFVTAGEKHVRFWTLIVNPDRSRKDGVDRSTDSGAEESTIDNESAQNEKVTLEEGRAGIIPNYKDATFTDVVCGTGQSSGCTYLVTQCGYLICMGSNRLMEKWVHLEAKSAYSISLSKGRLLCACSNGIIRIFEADTFEFVATLPIPRVSGNVALPTEQNESDEDEDNEEANQSRAGDVFGACWAREGTEVVSIYSDRSFHIWDISDPEKIRPKVRLLAHPTSVSCVATMRSSVFVTCADDSKLRFWRVAGYAKKLARTLQGPHWGTPLSQELLREVNLGSDIGFRCVAMSPDNQLVAAGDRRGGLFVYNLETDQCILEDLKAHGGEILSLMFSPRMMVGDEETQIERQYLVTGGRDRQVQLYDVTDCHDTPRRVQTLKDHSAVVTAVRFSVDGTKLLSTGGDKTIVLSSLEVNGRYRRVKSVNVPYGTIYDIDVDASNKYFCTSGQDKKINIWSLANGKSIRSYKPEGDPGDLTRILLDPAGMYCATGSQDKAVRLLDFYSGECLAKSAGHSEPITGLAFSADCKRLVSVAHDGCIFVWRLAPEITSAIKERKRELDHERAQAQIASKKKRAGGSVSAPTSANSEPDADHTKCTPSTNKSVEGVTVDNKENSTAEAPVSASNRPDQSQKGALSAGFFASAQLPAWAKTGGAAGAPVNTEGGTDHTGASWNPDATSSTVSVSSHEDEASAQGAVSDEEEHKDAVAEPLNRQSIQEVDTSATPSERADGESATTPPSARAQLLAQERRQRGTYSTPPGSPDETVKSLAQERAALRRQEEQQDTHDAVKRMRAQLKTMGILQATLDLKQATTSQTPLLVPANAKNDDRSTESRIIEESMDEEITTTKDVSSRGESDKTRSSNPLKALSIGTSQDSLHVPDSLNFLKPSTPSTAFRERVEAEEAVYPPPAPLEPPTPLSPKGRQPERSPVRPHAVPSLVPVPEEVLIPPELDSPVMVDVIDPRHHGKMAWGTDVNGVAKGRATQGDAKNGGGLNAEPPATHMSAASAYHAGTPLRSAEEARSACEFALNEVRSALAKTADIFRQVESLDANLTESLTRSQGADAFTSTVLETSRSHVRGLMSDFKSQLNDMVLQEVSSITSSRDGGMLSAFPGGNDEGNQFNRSMFLGSSSFRQSGAASATSATSADMSAMMDKLSTISSLLEQVVRKQS
mmetsp:Transcript_16271/g.31532  ORF Transcript_16271/g.31532 Transcript_16271/m.31532 type:complete len:1332 (+) Transcript_16271:637-4632(+)|eukprot:CAMPEP_0171568940 /NCGR_PEP_ID=MMETSP0961-20121227/2063_1 /TAXON_ID=87120 /ORGANISM="Aurantiochytrium limacinum, Strain ATCCMYA-1381" /LENGTH=1331 /DNA_ID=CAMNT_0012123165 /DNA_START=510 /DNA_END=4508 /DNA_ORIENTATION=+